MEQVQMTAEKRAPAGSRAAGRLRRKGLVPGVVYGHGEDPVSIAIDQHDLALHLQHGAHLLSLALDGKELQLLVKDVQYDHFGDRVLHIDLIRVDLDERVTVSVPLEFYGEPVGVTEEEGVLLTPMGEIEVECSVANIPDGIRVDVRQLGMNDSISVGDLKLPEGVDAVTPHDQAVATVTPPREEEEEPEAAEEAEGEAEPEVIGRAEEEEGEGESEEEDSEQK
jgi:large subunit ribosomal protein L25